MWFTEKIIHEGEEACQEKNMKNFKFLQFLNMIIL